jgi:hypothetical protein
MLTDEKIACKDPSNAPPSAKFHLPGAYGSDYASCSNGLVIARGRGMRVLPMRTIPDGLGQGAV